MNNALIAIPGHSRLGMLSVFLAIACVSACQPAGRSFRVVESEYREFGDLFSRADTVRFDASVLIGSMDFVDISDQGEFLITDNQSKAFHVFTASGSHVRTITVSQCNPEDGGSLASARFLEDGSVVATTAYGVYAFNADGSCRRRLLELTPNRPSFCEWRGLLYFLNASLRPPKIHAYSMESGIIEDYDLREPEFPIMAAVSRGRQGRSIACFERGIFYRYAESVDAEPLWPGSELVTHRPTFFRPLRRDLASTDDMGARVDDLVELLRESTNLNGIFKLDETHRLVAYKPWRENALNIVNMETQTSVSTKTDLSFILAQHGLVYMLGDYEVLPSGDVGNQMLEVWRFRSFEASHGDVAR